MRAQCWRPSGSTGCSNPAHSVSPGSITPANMSRIGTVDERFQSYNVEMVEVMGGRFWKPYKDINAILDQQASRKNSGSNPAGMYPNLYQYRAPIDLTNSRLRKLTAALGPAYMRVSGTWANTAYFPTRPHTPENSAQRFRRRADPSAIEGRHRLCACRGCDARHFLRHWRGNP